MKNEVILKIENENGSQEFVFQVKSWKLLMDMMFQDSGALKVTAKTMKNLMQVCQDDSLIGKALCYYRGRITGKEAVQVMERFPKSKNIQNGLIAYGVENNCMAVIKAVAKNPLDAQIQREVTDILEYNK